MVTITLVGKVIVRTFKLADINTEPVDDFVTIVASMFTLAQFALNIYCAVSCAFTLIPWRNTTADNCLLLPSGPMVDPALEKNTLGLYAKVPDVPGVSKHETVTTFLHSVVSPVAYEMW
jgi:hypothetical protein